MEPFTVRQKEIIDVSIKIIADKGIQQLTIKNISKDMKISEPAIYRHYDSKIDIILAILTSFEGTCSKLFSEINSMELSPVKEIETLYTKFFEQFTINPAFTAIIFSEEIFQNDRRLSERINLIMQSNQSFVINIVKIGQEKGEIRDDIPQEQLSLIIMGSLRLIVKKWRLSKYSFDLKQNGTVLLNSIKKMISN